MIGNIHIQKQNILTLISFCFLLGKTNRMEKEKIRFRGACQLINKLAKSTDYIERSG